MKSTLLSYFVLAILLVFPVYVVNAHCDTMDGPVVIDAKKAIEQNNVNYVLKWVQPANEKEVKTAFTLTMKVRVLGPDAQLLADSYFFETLVRLHRSGEGIPYTGVKPTGTPINERIFAADQSIALGNLSPLKNLVPEEKLPELQKRFDKVILLKNFDVNNVQAGRAYIEAYVQFFHYAEGEEEEEEGHQTAHAEAGEHEKKGLDPGEIQSYIPWSIAGIFFITSVILVLLIMKKKEKEKMM